MKTTLAKKISRQVSVLLLIAMVLSLVGAWQVVYNTVFRENKQYSETLLRIYSDLLLQSSMEKQIPLDTEHTEDAIRIGDTLRNSYGVDYLYLYVINEGESSVTYVAASFTDSSTEPGEEDDHLTGVCVEGDLLPDELKVWHGEKEIAQITLNYQYGHELTTLRRITDCMGNNLIAGVDISYASIVRQIRSQFLILSAIIAAVLFFIGAALYSLLKRKITAPARELSHRMVSYLRDGDRSPGTMPDEEQDEYAMIFSAFSSMTENIDYYVDHIRNLTAEQTNRQTELNIAASIQRGLLAEPDADGPDCRIHALMIPARDIGGDLYDYICLENGRWLTVIADVSGKGVTAAMFMSVTLTLIRQYARMGLMPDEILRQTNDSLVRNNSELLFVTAFVGLYDSQAQCYTYANAGHNPPYIIGDSLRMLDGGKGTVLGIYEGESYPSVTVPLLPGDTVFLYTDGITEAVNRQKQFWGRTGLEDVLKTCRATHQVHPLQPVWEAVQRFADGVEQNDDITMLTLTAVKKVSLETDYDLRAFEKIKAEILQLPLPRSRQLKLCLAAEEVFVNICSYSLDGQKPKGEKIGFSMTVSDRIELSFTDSGIPFNPLEQRPVTPSEQDDAQVGGLGTLLYISMVDDVQYTRQDGQNRLTLISYFVEDRNHDR